MFIIKKKNTNVPIKNIIIIITHHRTITLHYSNCKLLILSDYVSGIYYNIAIIISNYFIH